MLAEVVFFKFGRRPDRRNLRAGSKKMGMDSILKGLAMAQKRRRVKHILTFEERLAEEVRRFKEAAEKETPGSMARELLLRRARQAETAAHISEWLSSPGLQSPAR